jgi:hypothetical protein
MNGIVLIVVEMNGIVLIVIEMNGVVVIVVLIIIKMNRVKEERE